MASHKTDSYESQRKNSISSVLESIKESALRSKLIHAAHYYFNNILWRDRSGIPVKKDGSPQNLHYSRLPFSPQDPKRFPPPKCQPMPVHTPDDYCRLYLMNEMKHKQFSLASVDLSSLLNLVTCNPFQSLKVNDNRIFSEELVECVKDIRRIRNDWKY